MSTSPTQPYNLHSLEEPGKILIRPQGAVAEDLFDNPSDNADHPRVLWRCLLLGMHVGGIEEITKVFLPLPNYTLS